MADGAGMIWRSDSIMLHGAPVWEKEAERKTIKGITGPIHRRSALRSIRAYRIVSGDAACVLAETPSIPLLAAERVHVWDRQKVIGAERELTQEIKEIIREGKRETILAQ